MGAVRYYYYTCDGRDCDETTGDWGSEDSSEAWTSAESLGYVKKGKHVLCPKCQDAQNKIQNGVI